MPGAAENSQPYESFNVPHISHDELKSFYETHFSVANAANFGQSFTNCPSKDQGYPYILADDDWEEDDDLGYYGDGVKRTLTDEQIEIFRHSELRERQRQKEKANVEPADAIRATSADDLAGIQSQAEGSKLAANSRNNGKKKKRLTRGQKIEPKPDLRKRTWDVVEAGLDSLNYD